MKPDKLKSSEQKDLNPILKDYVCRNYNQQALTPNLESYFNNFSQNRNFLSLSR